MRKKKGEVDRPRTQKRHKDVYCHYHVLLSLKGLSANASEGKRLCATLFFFWSSAFGCFVFELEIPTPNATATCHFFSLRRKKSSYTFI